MAELHTVEWGEPSGPPVVCIHGLSSHCLRYRRLADALPTHRVVSVDLRGHGRSTWEAPWTIESHLADLVETADALGIGSATWVGHSFGGRLVAELAAGQADRVERAVLLDPALHIEPATATARAELLLTDISFATVDEAIDARHADDTLFATPRETIVTEAEDHLQREEDGRYRWRYSRGMAVAAWSAMATPAPPWPDCPTLVVIGAKTWIPIDVPPKPHLTTVVVPGGHSVLWDSPEETVAAVVDYLATGSEATSRS
jgi:lipase